MKIGQLVRTMLDKINSILISPVTAMPGFLSPHFSFSSGYITSSNKAFHYVLPRKKAALKCAKKESEGNRPPSRLAGKTKGVLR